MVIPRPSSNESEFVTLFAEIGKKITRVRTIDIMQTCVIGNDRIYWATLAYGRVKNHLYMYNYLIIIIALWSFLGQHPMRANLSHFLTRSEKNQHFIE